MRQTIRGLGRVYLPGQGNCLGVITDEGLRVDPSAGDLAPLVSRCDGPAAWQDALRGLAVDARRTIPWDALAAEPEPRRAHLLAPIDRQECWGAGCTYRVDEESLGRMRQQRPLYAAVTEADRPLLFFKGNPRRAAGPGATIACRPGAARTIPEAELAVLLGPTGRPLAFALGNDVTALDLEQENPLYQPQAKVFDGGMALGPWWTSAAAAPDAFNTPFSCTVVHEGQTVLRQQIDPGRLMRSIDELAGWLFEAATFPEGVVLLTGGGAAVPPGFALADGDTVMISHPDLAELENQVGAVVQDNAGIWEEAGVGNG